MLHVTRHEPELGRWETVRREPERRLLAQVTGSAPREFLAACLASGGVAG